MALADIDAALRRHDDAVDSIGLECASQVEFMGVQLNGGAAKHAFLRALPFHPVGTAIAHEIETVTLNANCLVRIPKPGTPLKV